MALIIIFNPALFSSLFIANSVHDDIQLCQWLKTKDGRLKFGDFNRAEAMEWDGKEEEYCKYYNGGCWGNVSDLFMPSFPAGFSNEYRMV